MKLDCARSCDGQCDLGDVDLVPPNGDEWWRCERCKFLHCLPLGWVDLDDPSTWWLVEWRHNEGR